MLHAESSIPSPASLTSPGLFPPPLVVRTEHIGSMRSEQQAQFQPKFGTEGYAKMRSTAPGGGASALGTAPLPMPGTRGTTRVGLYDSLRQAEQISTMRS